MDIPEGPRHLQPPEAEDGAEDGRGHRPSRTRGPVDTDRLYRKFSGTYPALVEALLQLRPESVGAPPVTSVSRLQGALNCTHARFGCPALVWSCWRDAASLAGVCILQPLTDIGSRPVVQVGAMGARLLCRLRAYEQAAGFQVGCSSRGPW
jgi:hypothetical protein